MTCFLQTGVRVSDLYLPEIRVEEELSTSTWSPLVRLMTGIDMDDEGRLASVRHIKMPGSYVDQLHFAQFCSALVYAKGVESFSLMCGAKKNLMGSTSATRRHSWRWLAFALFSEVSTSSMTKLCLRGEGPVAWELSAIRTMVESENPFAVLRDSATETNDLYPELKPHFARRVITIRPWAYFLASDCIHSFDSHSRVALQGELLVDAPHGRRVAFVPGYGLVWGQLPSYDDGSKPALPVAIGTCASSLVDLAIETPGKSAVNPQDILALLNIIGRRLRGLMVESQADESTVQGILHACPNLESFRFKSRKLTSLNALTNAYANGAKISSLDVRVTEIPRGASPRLSPLVGGCNSSPEYTSIHA